MLIQFSVSNFLSFDETETLSMIAGKARKNIDRIYKSKKIKLTKCEVILGANASGKSNLVSALQFIQQMIVEGLPLGFSNKYFRLKPENKNLPSEFEIQFLSDSKIFVYGFSIILSTGSIINEYLYEQTSIGSKKELFTRDTVLEEFNVGTYFKTSEAVAKLLNYGEDSVNDQETLFLSIINKNKRKMFLDIQELTILQNIYEWFSNKLNISFPESILTGYPYFTDTNLDEIAELLHALGTGISKLKIVEVPVDKIKTKFSDEIYNRIVSDLEKANAHSKSISKKHPKIMARAYKEFYTFEIDQNNNIKITTI